MVFLPQAVRLVPFAQQAVADREDVQLGTHETAEGILGRMNDRLTTNVKAGIDQNRDNLCGVQMPAAGHESAD